jgi:uncharacterized membrane protein YdjX (TVP38/TMEM64 family)
MAAIVREPSWSTMPGAATWSRVALLAVLAIAAVALYTTGVLDVFRAPETLRTLLLRAGLWGAMLYLVSFVVLQPLGLPGVVFVFAAGLVWPKPLAFALALAGALGAGAVGFVFARYLARDWVATRLPDRFRRLERQLDRHGLAAVAMVRVIFFLAPPAHWVLGLSSIRFSTFMLGSLIGLLPGVAVLTLVGSSGIEWLTTRGVPAWIVIAGFVAAGLVALSARRWRA